MKKHSRFEFVIEKTKQSFAGDSQEHVFGLLMEGSLGATPKTKAKLFFEAHDITDDVPDVNDKEKFYDEFFIILQNHLVGTWKWYDSLCNDEFWRYEPTKNDLVRRVGMGRGKRSPEAIEKLKANLAISHERRRSNPELAKRIAASGGKATKGLKRYSDEQKAEKAKQLRNGRLRKYAEMTDEEREENRRKHSEAMRLFHQRRREQGLEYKGAKADKQRTENNDEQQQ